MTKITNHPNRKLLTALVALMAVCFTSCVSTKKATYFNDLKDATYSSGAPVPENVITPSDILSITVTSLNKEESQLYNQSAKSEESESKKVEGYLVNSSGFIQFPVLGNVKAAGQTKEQLRIAITELLVQNKLLLDPIVTIRFQNFRVTVLGEVKNPAVINVPNEKVSLLQAIGLAGDLTIYAKRNNVLLIREEDGKRVVRRLDLNSNELFTSQYYYLQSNDIIYVEPNKARVAGAGRAQIWIPVMLSALTVTAIVGDRIIK